MDINLVNSIILSALFLGLFGTAEFLYHYFKIQVEYTRKLVHIGTGLLTMLFPVLLDSHWYVLFLCSSFAAILLLSLNFNLLKSINAIDRDSVGSILYPVAVYFCFLFFEMYQKQVYWFYLPILTMALADPAAALVGKHFPIGRYKLGEGTKTMSGSIAFAIVAFGICFAFTVSIFSMQHSILLCFVAAIVTSFTEAISKRGWDNLLIPLASLLVLFLNQIITNG